jgi:hypothetical protein
MAANFFSVFVLFYFIRFALTGRRTNEVATGAREDEILASFSFLSLEAGHVVNYVAIKTFIVPLRRFLVYRLFKNFVFF